MYAQRKWILETGVTEMVGQTQLQAGKMRTPDYPVGQDNACGVGHSKLRLVTSRTFGLRHSDESFMGHVTNWAWISTTVNLSIIPYLCQVYPQLMLQTHLRH